MNYSYLKVFYLVATLQNISKAATILNVTQPAVSRIISSIEKEYNTKLFNRYKSGVSLTQEGLNLFNKIKGPIQELERIEREINSNDSLSKKIIHIGATSTSLLCYLLPQLDKMKLKYQNMIFKIYTDSSLNLMNLVKKGLIDFAFITTPFTTTEDIESYNFYQLEDILVAPASYRQSLSGKISIKSLFNYPFILLNKNMQFRQLIDNYLLSYGININPTYETDSSSVLLPFVEHNCGLTFIPKIMATESIEQGKCFQVNLDEKIPSRFISLIIKKERKNYYPTSDVINDLINKS